MTLRQHVAPMISGFVGATIAISLLGGAAYAATGGTFVLGRSNSATTVTTLTNSTGTALYLKSKSGTPALKVGNTVKVPLLNADKLDGFEATAFARTNATFAVVMGGAPEVANFYGNDDVNDSAFSIATCPAGTVLVSGGGSQDAQKIADLGTVAYTGPIGGNSWVFHTIGVASQPMAYAVCYKALGGTVAGGMPVDVARSLSLR